MNSETKSVSKNMLIYSLNKWIENKKTAIN